LHNYTKYIHSYSSIINKYVNDNEPWNKKNNSEQNIKNILFSTLVALKNIFILLYPIMPYSSIKFLKSLNINENEIKMNKINEKLITNDQLTKPDILFKKYE
jgi:methionyl-tRNA synthetase